MGKLAAVHLSKAEFPDGWADSLPFELETNPAYHPRLVAKGNPQRFLCCQDKRQYLYKIAAMTFYNIHFDTAITDGGSCS